MGIGRRIEGKSSRTMFSINQTIIVFYCESRLNRYSYQTSGFIGQSCDGELSQVIDSFDTNY